MKFGFYCIAEDKLVSSRCRKWEASDGDERVFFPENPYAAGFAASKRSSLQKKVAVRLHWVISVRWFMEIVFTFSFPVRSVDPCLVQPF